MTPTSGMPEPHAKLPRSIESQIAAVDEGDDTLVSALNMLLRNRTLLLALPAAIALVVAVWMLFQPRTYRSEAAFVPQRTQRAPSAFTGLAAQFGIALPGEGLDQSPAFYADLVRSREILGEVVESSYEEASGATLAEVFEIDENDANRRSHLAIERVRRTLRQANDVETGVVTFSVALEDGAVARAVAEKVIAEINAFNMRRRRSLAEAERSFVEDRLGTANAELVSAESALRTFDERNLRIDNSPELRLERDRLMREVGMRQEVVTMLTQAYEQARIDEVRNTPAITVIERPSTPVKPERRGTVQYALLAFLVSGFVMTGLVLARELYTRIEAGDSRAHQEFRELRRSLGRWLPARRRGSR
jgi:uncharacterized protein involved in exopolysaccharide biosynthesis